MLVKLFSFVHALHCSLSQIVFTIGAKFSNVFGFVVAMPAHWNQLQLNSHSILRTLRNKTGKLFYITDSITRYHTPTIKAIMRNFVRPTAGGSRQLKARSQHSRHSFSLSLLNGVCAFGFFATHYFLFPFSFLLHLLQAHGRFYAVTRFPVM